ncbi:hypothetical protein KY309_01220 [Candidatus Woesearchaeota archaeon]|nr:hypothetical protein [Candidatus Woesearchaeota archaeon]MBW3016213.1 hypothetical protein [Candidatus Woesearchaeota archaeon]
MGIFDKTEEEIIAFVQKVHSNWGSDINTPKFAEMQEESKNFANLFQDFSIYVESRKEFVQHPNRDAFNSLKVLLERLQQSLKNIQEKHNIQQLLDWLEHQLIYEQNFVTGIELIK